MFTNEDRCLSEQLQTELGEERRASQEWKRKCSQMYSHQEQLARDQVPSSPCQNEKIGCDGVER